MSLGSKSLTVLKIFLAIEAGYISKKERLE
jgi:hypothetical protein